MYSYCACIASRVRILTAAALSRAWGSASVGEETSVGLHLCSFSSPQGVHQRRRSGMAAGARRPWDGWERDYLREFLPSLQRICIPNQVAIVGLRLGLAWRGGSVCGGLGAAVAAVCASAWLGGEGVCGGAWALLSPARIAASSCRRRRRSRCRCAGTCTTPVSSMSRYSICP